MFHSSPDVTVGQLLQAASNLMASLAKLQQTALRDGSISLEAFSAVEKDWLSLRDPVRQQTESYNVQAAVVAPAPPQQPMPPFINPLQPAMLTPAPSPYTEASGMQQHNYAATPTPQPTAHYPGQMSPNPNGNADPYRDPGSAPMAPGRRHALQQVEGTPPAYLQRPPSGVVQPGQNMLLEPQMGVPFIPPQQRPLPPHFSPPPINGPWSR